MQIRGWLTVYPGADERTRTGYFFSADPPPVIIDHEAVVHVFEVTIPWPLSVVEARLVEPEIAVKETTG